MPQQRGAAPDSFQADSFQPDSFIAEEKPQARTWVDSVRDFGSSLISAVNPIPALDHIYRHGWMDTLNQLAGAQKAEADKGKAAYEKGDYLNAVAHTVNWAIPILGPLIGNAQQQLAEGKTASGLGASVGLGLSIAGPKAVLNRARAVLPNPPSEAPFAERLYQSALKPSTTLGPSERTAVLQTGLREGIPVSEAGLEKLQGLVEDLNGKIADRIRASGRQGITVEPERVAARTAQTRATFENQVTPESDLGVIDRMRQEFLARNSKTVQVPAGTATAPTGLLNAQGRPITKTMPLTEAEQVPVPIPAEKAQALKVGTYRQLKTKSFGELKGAEIETQKALARGLKEELAAQIPEIAALNERESRFFKLEPELERAIGRIGNREIGGIGTPIKAAGAKAITGSGPVAAFYGLLHSILNQPAIKSRLAIAINHVQTAKPRFANAGVIAGRSARGMALANATVEAYLKRLEDAANAQTQQSAQPAAAPNR